MIWIMKKWRGRRSQTARKKYLRRKTHRGGDAYLEMLDAQLASSSPATLAATGLLARRAPPSSPPYQQAGKAAIWAPPLQPQAERRFPSLKAGDAHALIRLPLAHRPAQHISRG